MCNCKDMIPHLTSLHQVVCSNRRLQLQVLTMTARGMRRRTIIMRMMVMRRMGMMMILMKT